MGHNTQPIRLPVRALAETVHRRGGLAGPVYGGVSAQEGIRLHKRCQEILQKELGQLELQTEVALQATVNLAGYQLLVSGRCDALVESPAFLRIYEIKSFTGSADQLPAKGEQHHWAQALLYAWLYLLGQEKTVKSMEVGLVYISLDSQTVVQHVMTYERHYIENFAQKTCQQYLDFAANILRNEPLRKKSGLDLAFPYPVLREGQKRFMQEVVGAVRQKGCVNIIAPTGIGKTMASLYPAVKALANNLVEHVFYLTSMTSTRLVAARAMQDLHEKGLLMKSLTIYAKEKLCLEPGLYCDTRQCPYALTYYENLPAALAQLFLHTNLGQEEILAAARRHQVCPFELSLDMALYCEVIICDYNYAFDPRVRLQRFFSPETQELLLLVDEAHNLPRRSRDMYSASLANTELAAMAKQLAIFPKIPLQDELARILDWFTSFTADLDQDGPGFSKVEAKIKPAEVMQAEKFRASRSLPLELLARISRFNSSCHLFLQDNRDFPGRQDFLQGFFKLLFFTRVAEEFFDGAYVTTASGSAGQLLIQLLCLDAAEKLAASYLDRHAAVFFSATLAPLSYYSRLLQGRRQYDSESLQLGSPFPAENLLVLVCPTLSTRYAQRQATTPAILELILSAVRQKTSNYLVFLPSYAYLQQVRFLLRQKKVRDDFDYMFQVPEMSENNRRKYLARFEQFGSRTLLAFAVMGGLFAEGIDLAGEKLAGVIIVGVGMPRPSPELEIMRQYYGELLGSGYEYAYLYPGFNRVQQAAGRVIRSENDRGFILLIDDRYETPGYRSLFPHEWQPQNIANELEASQLIQEFWGLDQGSG